MVGKHPLATSIGLTDHVRRRWIRSVMENQRDILAVQTLRNHIMAATFLASTAMIVSLGVLSAAFRPAGFGWMTQDLQPSGATGNTTLATADKGNAALDHGARGFVELLQEIDRFDLSRLKPGPLG